MANATSGMVEARKAIERALTGPTSGGNARSLAPVILGAIVNGAVPGVTFTPLPPAKLSDVAKLAYTPAEAAYCEARENGATAREAIAIANAIAKKNSKRT